MTKNIQINKQGVYYESRSQAMINGAGQNINFKKNNLLFSSPEAGIPSFIEICTFMEYQECDTNQNQQFWNGQRIEQRNNLGKHHSYTIILCIYIYIYIYIFY